MRKASMGATRKFTTDSIAGNSHVWLVRAKPTSARARTMGHEADLPRPLVTKDIIWLKYQNQKDNRQESLGFATVHKEVRHQHCQRLRAHG